MTHDEYIKHITEKQNRDDEKIKAYQKELLVFIKSKNLKKVSALSLSYKYEYLLPKKNLPNFLDAVITFAVGSDGDITLSWNLVIGCKEKFMHYLFGEKLDIKSFTSVGISYEALKDGTFLESCEYTFLKNRLNIYWHINDIEKFYNILDEFDTKMQMRYASLNNILEDLEKKREKCDIFRKQTGQTNWLKDKKSYLPKVALYELFGEKEKAIKELETYIEELPPIDQKGYQYERLMAYLNHLKTGNPVQYIASPADKISVLQCTDEDIYICLNRKTIKDADILEYFGGIDKFGKAEKIQCEDMVSNNGVTICKAGKWSIIRLSFKLIIDYSQDELSNMLLDMSNKYNRAILCVNQETTATFGFEVYKKGELIRRWMAGDGEVFENIGKPLVGEKKRFIDSLKDEIDANCVSEFLNEFLKITHGDTKKAVLYMIK